MRLVGGPEANGPASRRVRPAPLGACAERYAPGRPDSAPAPREWPRLRPCGAANGLGGAVSVVVGGGAAHAARRAPDHNGELGSNIIGRN